jgi:hypothetical protein
MDIAAIDTFGKASGIYAFMNTAWGWPTTESVHFAALAVLLGTVGVFDLRMLGMAPGIPLSALHRLVPFGVGAYVVSVATGSMFFVAAPDQYAFNPAFQLKLCCMIIAGLNVAAFYSAPVQRLATLGPADPVPAAIKVMAAISLGSWLGVIVFGRLITMFRPPYHWCWWC